MCPVVSYFEVMGNSVSCRSSIPDHIWDEALADLTYDISFIQDVMKINRQFRAIGIRAIRLRILRLLRTFIPPTQHDSFFFEMQRLRSVIGGSFAHAVLAPAYFEQVFLTSDYE